MSKQKNRLLAAMLAVQDHSQVAILSSFFKTGTGQYGEGDLFLGIKVPTTRKVVKSLSGQMSFDELEECIASKYHEVRLAALLALIDIYKRAGKDVAFKKACVDFYLAHTAQINNWDLVDLSCYELLGDWLLDKDRLILHELAKNGKTIWEQRIGIVSTMKFVRNGQIDDTLSIAELLLDSPHDLIHKAVGWLLREVGKRNCVALVSFLNAHLRRMPRTTLRYAIERFPEDERKMWLAK